MDVTAAHCLHPRLSFWQRKAQLLHTYSRSRAVSHSKWEQSSHPSIQGRSHYQQKGTTKSRRLGTGAAAQGV